MGLIQAAISATSSTFSDQWKEYFYCDAIPSDTICVKGHKKISGMSSNRGNDNIITDGSVIAVADGQCMVIVEQGQVVEICAQPGEFQYSSTTEPSLFTGSLGEGLKNVFATIGKRFTFGGQPAEDQRVYYFNTKEIPGIKYGTASPVPFRVVDRNVGLDVDISLKCFGEYSIKITDPISFYTNVCGNVADSYKVSSIEGMMRTELLTALQPAFAKLSEAGIRYSAIPGHTLELADALNEQLSAKWKEQRGMEIASFGVSSIKASEEDEQMIKELQRDAAFRDPSMANATLVGATAQAMKDAAKNTGGAATAFMGMNMAGNMGASMFQQTAPAQQPAANGWTCPQCGNVNTGNFCSSCGTKKPAPSGSWFCPQCGQENTGNFCSSCGQKKPQ